VGKEAKEILDAVNAGTSLKEVAAKRSLTTTTTPPIEREGEAGGLPDTMVGPLFQLKPHQATSGQSADGSYVAELLEIVPADPDADKAKVDQLAQQLRTSLQQDLMSQYENALRERFPVQIDRDRVSHAL
jgi:peptidyl-prolyl cis-trans isomerase D